MKALVCNHYGPPEDLNIETHAAPSPGPDQIAVKVAAAGINFPDVLTIAGKYQEKTEPPFIPGNEAAGVVTACGNDVSDFNVGDKVIVTTRGGAFAEQCIGDAKSSIALPAKLNFEQGAGFAVTYGTSYHALKQSAQLQANETLLVLGAAGGVGVAAIEIAKSMGARVIAAASSREKLAFAKEAGADEIINYARDPLKESVKEMTAGQGADVVYDPVGGALADQALRATAWQGRYLVVGFASGDIPAFKANLALLKEASIIGVWWGTWAAKNPKGQMQNMHELTELANDGRLSARVTEVYALSDFAAAFRSITERRARGKVVLRMR